MGYAALKGRSSTVVRAFQQFSANCKAAWIVAELTAWLTRFCSHLICSHLRRDASPKIERAAVDEQAETGQAPSLL